MFTAVHSIEEEPDSAPAASPCLRRRPSARPRQDRASPTPRSSPPDGKGCATPGPDPPGSSRSSVERLYTISSSRTPLDPHSPSPRHLAVLTHPGFVGAAPTLTDTSRLGLPPAFSRPLRRSTGAGLSPPLKQQRLTAHETSPERVRDHVPRPYPNKSEYNRSIPGALKNAIDWASRPWGQNAFDHIPAAVIGASIGQVGTAMAQQSLRGVLSFCNARQMTAPEAYIKFSHDTFIGNGEVADESTVAFLSNYLKEFRDHVARVLSVLPR